MLHKIVRVLAGSAAVMGTLSVIPMISDRATAQAARVRRPVPRPRLPAGTDPEAAAAD